MLEWLWCLLGRHDWTRIGSAPAEFTAYDRFDKVWDAKGTSLVPRETIYEGFMLLLECRTCGDETGRSEYGATHKKHSAAFARSFIERCEKGRIRKSDPYAVGADS